MDICLNILSGCSNGYKQHPEQFIRTNINRWTRGGHNPAVYYISNTMHKYPQFRPLIQRGGLYFLWITFKDDENDMFKCFMLLDNNNSPTVYPNWITQPIDQDDVSYIKDWQTNILEDIKAKQHLIFENLKGTNVMDVIPLDVLSMIVDYVLGIRFLPSFED